MTLDVRKQPLARVVTEVNFGAWAQGVTSVRPSRLAPFVFRAYKVPALRKLCLSMIMRIEGGEMHSPTLRRLLEEFHGVHIGSFTYGACLVPGCIPEGSSFGNFCSVADGLRVFRRNHPLSRLSQHPFFYNRHMGLLSSDAIESVGDNPLHVGHDVWIGARVTILPGCRMIGNGAVVGAGAVVTRDVAPYSIVVGNPARTIGIRFPKEIQSLVERTRWWELPLSKLVAARHLLFEPMTCESLEEFLAQLEKGQA